MGLFINAFFFPLPLRPAHYQSDPPLSAGTTTISLL
jgi:hypothetical protein